MQDVEKGSGQKISKTPMKKGTKGQEEEKGGDIHPIKADLQEAKKSGRERSKSHEKTQAH